MSAELVPPLMTIRQIVAHNIRRARELSGRSQTWLAQESGMSRQGINNIEAGRKAATLDSIAVLAEALGVRPADLMESPETCPTCGQWLPDNPIRATEGDSDHGQ